MPRNVYISNGVKTEQDLYEELIIEAMQIYGTDVYYIPRSYYSIDTILNEDTLSKFEAAFKLEMYICLLYTSPSPRDGATSRMPSSA